MSLGKAKTTAGCEIDIGAFMGASCPTCGADNFGGEGFCRSSEERAERQNRETSKESDDV